MRRPLVYTVNIQEVKISLKKKTFLNIIMLLFVAVIVVSLTVIGIKL